MDKNIKNTMKPHLLIGIAVLLIVEIVIKTFKLLIPEQFQYWRLISGQLILIGCAVLAAIMLKWDLREVFPAKKLRTRQLLGVVLFFVNTIFLNALINGIIAYFSPQVTGTFNKIYNLTIPVSLVLTAVLPAVCEESLYRGFALYTFKNVKNKWITVAAIGVIFGTVHWNLAGFLSLAVLGAVLAYIMLETKNIILPMLLHFLNNALVALTTANANESITPPSYDPETASAIGWLLICFTAVPFMLVWGSRLLKTKEHNRLNALSNKAKWIMVLSAAFCLAAGICIVILADFN